MNKQGQLLVDHHCYHHDGLEMHMIVKWKSVRERERNKIERERERQRERERKKKGYHYSRKYPYIVIPTWEKKREFEIRRLFKSFEFKKNK